MPFRRQWLLILAAGTGVLYNLIMRALPVVHDELFRMEYAVANGCILLAIVTIIACTAESGVKYSKFKKIPIVYIGFALMAFQVVASILLVLLAAPGKVAICITYPILFLGLALMLLRYNPPEN